MLTIEVDAERVDEAIHKAARKVSRETNIPGFRRGKAPFGVVLQMVGRQTLLQEALDGLGQEVYEEALKEAEIEPYSSADLVDVQLEPMVLKMSVPVDPVVDLGDYRTLRLEDRPDDVTDEEIVAQIEAMRKENSSWVPVERGAAFGDRVTYTRQRDDEEPSEPRDLILAEGLRYPAPGFSAELVGLKAGDSKEFAITYPEDWSEEELAGATESYHVMVEEVKEQELPSLEDLPALVGDYEDAEALRAGVRQQIVDEKAVANNRQLLKKAIDILVEQAAIEFPSVMVDSEIDSILERHDTALRRQGLDLDSYLKMSRTSREEHAEKQREDATERVKRNLVLARLSELEQLRIEKDELKEQLTERSRVQGGEVSEEMLQVLTSPAGMQYVASDILMAKVYERLLAIVKGEAPELEPETAEETEAGEESAEPTPEADADEAETPAATADEAGDD